MISVPIAKLTDQDGQVHGNLINNSYYFVRPTDSTSNNIGNNE